MRELFVRDDREPSGPLYVPPVIPTTTPRAEPRQPAVPPERPLLSPRIVAAAVAGLALVAGLAVVLGPDGEEESARVAPAAATQPGGEGVFAGSAVPGDITLGRTTQLRDGDEVSVRVVAHDGTEIYGFEAFLCAAGVTFQLDADVRPDDTGNCVTKPLSPGSDRYKQVRGQPPYRVVETTFRAGTGTDTYVTSEGTPVTISCGPGRPCQLVLKVQYPNGYGFRAYPLEYA